MKSDLLYRHRGCGCRATHAAFPSSRDTDPLPLLNAVDATRGLPDLCGAHAILANNCRVDETRRTHPFLPHRMWLYLCSAGSDRLGELLLVRMVGLASLTWPVTKSPQTSCFRSSRVKLRAQPAPGRACKRAASQVARPSTGVQLALEPVVQSGNYISSWS